MRKIFSALDIGSDTIKLVVGEFINDKLNILCAKNEPSSGFKHNGITDSEELIKSIKNVINEASKQINFEIKKVLLNIPTHYTNFILTELTMPIEHEDLTVTSMDVIKILQKSATNAISPSDELIGVEPVIFKVGDNETSSPVNKKGKTLSVKSLLVTSDKKTIYDLVKLLEKASLEVVDITIDGLVLYYNFRNESLDQKNGVIINLGNTSTSLNIISKGLFINREVIDAGGYDLDKDIAFIYNLKKKDARYLKENLAKASSRMAEPKEVLQVTNRNNEIIVINQYEITEVVSSRLNEILKLTKKSINHLTKKEISYIIITGGLTELKDFSIEVSSIYGNTIQIGNINVIGARNNKYSVALGMLLYFNEKLKLRNKEYSTVSDEDIEQLCNNDSKSSIANDSILGKVFGYFFDN